MPLARSSRYLPLSYVEEKFALSHKIHFPIADLVVDQHAVSCRSRQEYSCCGIVLSCFILSAITLYYLISPAE